MNNGLIPSDYKVTLDITPGAMLFLGGLVAFIVFTSK
jgi:hypothetical protein